jgi:hypothetical protein
VPAKLYEVPPKPVVAATPGNTPIGKTAPGLVQRNRNGFAAAGGRPTPYGMGPRGGGGNFGRPNFMPFGNNRNMGGGGGGTGYGGAGPRNFGGGNRNFGGGMGYGGGPRPGPGGGMGFGRGMGGGGGGPGPRNNDRGAGMGFGRGGMNDDIVGGGGLPDAGVIDALQLLSQLRNKVNAAPAPQKIDIPFYRRDSPIRDDFSRDRGNNDFGSNRASQIPFSRNEPTIARGNSNSMDFTSANARPNFNNRNDFDSGRGGGGGGGFSSSFGNSNIPSRNSFGGSSLNQSNEGGGGGDGGGGWFKVL